MPSLRYKKQKQKETWERGWNVCHSITCTSNLRLFQKLIHKVSVIARLVKAYISMRYVDLVPRTPSS